MYLEFIRFDSIVEDFKSLKECRETFNTLTKGNFCFFNILLLIINFMFHFHIYIIVMFFGLYYHVYLFSVEKMITGNENFDLIRTNNLYIKSIICSPRTFVQVPWLMTWVDKVAILFFFFLLGDILKFIK